MDYLPRQKTEADRAIEERAAREAEKLRRISIDFAFASPGTQSLGLSPDKTVLEMEAPALEKRGRAFIQRLADLMEARNMKPFIEFQRLMAENEIAFGMEKMRQILAHHYYTGSGSGKDGDQLSACTHLDFPEPYNIEGTGGIVEKIVRAFPAEFTDYVLNPVSTDPVASFSLGSQEAVSRALASPQTESEAR